MKPVIPTSFNLKGIAGRDPDDDMDELQIRPVRVPRGHGTAPAAVAVTSSARASDRCIKAFDARTPFPLRVEPIQ
jgi:hypothetical protein